MALARVVMFDGVTRDRIPGDAVRDARLPAAGRVPAKEIIVLHDPDAEKSVVLLFFDSEEDYRQGDEALSAMAAGETRGQRTRVAKYDVAMRMATCESAAGYPVGNGGAERCSALLVLPSAI